MKLSEKIQKALEEFGRNYSLGECSYCPSTSEDCKKCKKMIKTLTQILFLIKERIPKKKTVRDLLKGRNIGIEAYIWKRGYNQAIVAITKELE